jgi:hypothetical protein
MRKVSYCAAGTFVSFPIPETVYRDLDAEVAEDDMRAPCAVLERVVARVRQGQPAIASPDAVSAAARIWRFCNQGRDDGEDVVVIDYIGDGRSVEFSPVAGLDCASGRGACACTRLASEAKSPVPA